MDAAKANEKKVYRKVAKCISSISKEIPVNKSSEVTAFLLICNAGLTTSCTQECLVRIFQRFGTIVRVVMITGKSFSFVQFQDASSSVNCLDNLNGSFCLDGDAKPLYFCCVDSIPSRFLDEPACVTEFPEGLKLCEDFVTKDEEQLLLSIIDWRDSGSDLKNRRVKHYGFTFLYETSNIDREKPLPGGLPEESQIIIKRLMSEKLITSVPDQITVNQYQPGQGIPSHVDTHSAFEDEIVSLSLGSPVNMEFKHPDGRQLSVLLPGRSCLIMSGEARYLWTHGITPRKYDTIKSPLGGLTLHQRGVRTSFTLRKVRSPAKCTCPFPAHCDSQKENSTSISESSADQIERTHVFQVYENIANHFSDTRHRPWPQVLTFVQSLPPGSILVDVGCGNGKYLAHYGHIFNMGCDRSHNLLQVCRSRKHEVFQADCRNVPLRDGVADACISIAVIHHLATEQRRLQAIYDMCKLLTKGGRALIYVWAKEQQRDDKKSTYLLQRKNETETQKPDVFVGSVLPVHENRTDFRHADVLVPWKVNPKTASLKDSHVQEATYHRFYHVFAQGELESLCRQVDRLSIVHSYYDQGNWCVIIQKI